ncbi:MAG: AAA family ATPase [DPANN group archaeon]|nr:AAA family ATPase [DPANN group archaeon]
MSMFDTMLKDGESLFKNEIALDFSFQPKLIPHRESEQRLIINAIKPLLQRRNGRNLILTGKPGIGKTALTRHVLQILEDESETLPEEESAEVMTVFINCWKKNTSFKIAEDICHQIGYMLTQNKRTDELLGMIVRIANKKSVVLVFDEIDKVDDHDFLYTLLEELYRKTIILITNYDEWYAGMDERIRSRFMPEMVRFEPYSARATRDILDQRKEYAFVPGVWEDEAFDLVVDKAFEVEDIRTGLQVMKEAGIAAEDKASRKIGNEHVGTALKKAERFAIKDSDQLEEETQTILDIVKGHSGKRIGDLFRLYEAGGGKLNYKSFQRKIKKLADNSYVTTEKQTGGANGTTTFVSYGKEKKLTDF